MRKNIKELLPSDESIACNPYDINKQLVKYDAFNDGYKRAYYEHPKSHTNFMIGDLEMPWTSGYMAAVNQYKLTQLLKGKV